jgi:MFS family permease
MDAIELSEQYQAQPQEILKDEGEPGSSPSPISNDGDKSTHARYTTPDFQAMISIVFWNSLGFFFYIYMLSYVSAQLMNATGTQLGLVFSSQTVGGLISAPFVGYLTDKISKKKLVLVGSFGRGFSYIIMYSAILLNSILLFSISTFTLGVLVGFFWTPLDALTSAKSDKRYRSRAFGRRMGVMGWGNFIGSIGSFAYFGVMLYFFPDALWLIFLPLLAFTGFNVFAGIRFYKQLDENLTYDSYVASRNSTRRSEGLESHQLTSEKEAQSANSTRSITFQYIAGVLVLMFAFLVANVNQSIASPFLQVYLMDDLEVHNPILVMLVFFPAQIISMVLAPKFGKLGDRFSPYLTIAVVSGLGAGITWFLIRTTSPIEFGFLLIVDQALAFTGHLVLVNLLSRLSKSNRGKIFGMTHWFSLLGGGIGPYVGGLIWDTVDHTAPFQISIVIELTLIPLFILAILMLNRYMEEQI